MPAYNKCPALVCAKTCFVCGLLILQVRIVHYSTASGCSYFPIIQTEVTGHLDFEQGSTVPE